MPAPATDKHPTRPSAASGWRVPAAIVLLVLLVCLAVFLIVLSDLRTDANRQAAAQMHVPSAAPTAP
jgi:hypothetical protein